MDTNKLGGYSSVNSDYFKSEDAAMITTLHGTPTFILDVHAARKQLREMERILPNVYLYYPVKVNPHPAIINLVNQNDYGFDVATVGEITHVIQHGVDPGKLLYTHPVKSDEEIRLAESFGVSKFTLDSIEELLHHEQLIPNAEHFVRVAPLSNASLYDYKNKFGTSPGELIAVLNYAIKKDIPITGISFMVGSQTMSLNPWIETLGYIASVIRRYYTIMPSLRTINIGSGIPLDYDFRQLSFVDEIGKLIRETRDTLPEDIKFVSEIGRFIVGPSSVLATSVIQKINRRGDQWLYTDANAYSGLIEIIESGGTLPYPITCSKAGPNVPYTIAGKTLDPDDVFGRNRFLGSDITSGDKLFIHDVGAYSSSFFTNYHALPHPQIITCDSEYSANARLAHNAAGFPGLKATRTINTGETVFIISGPITLERTRTTFQLDAEHHIEPSLFGAYLNHSCKPNLGIRTAPSNDQLEIIALKPIARNEDLEIDYAMFEYETGPMAKITCLCGAEDCRRFIGGYKDLPQHIRDRYKDHTTAYINSMYSQKIQAAK